MIGLAKGLVVLRVSFLSKQIFAAAFLALSFVPALAGKALLPEEAARLMPDKLGDFRAQGVSRPSELDLIGKGIPEDFNAYSAATRVYLSERGGAFALTLVRTRSEASCWGSWRGTS